jgi:hypothetical protein
VATPSERDLNDDDRGIRDRGAFEGEEADLRGTGDRAGVRSIIRSGPHRGRLVFDPERRFTPVPVPESAPPSGENTKPAPSKDSRPHGAETRTRTGKVLRVRPKRTQGPPPPVQPLEEEPELRPERRPGFSPRRTFKESTFQKVQDLKELIKRESGGDPLLARAIAGSYAEEFDGRGWGDEKQDGTIALKSEPSLKLARLQVDLDTLVRERPGFFDKQANPFTNDIGPANIKLATAVLLVEQSRLQFDRIDLREPYRSIVKELLTDEGTVKAAAAVLSQGKEEFQRLGVWDKVPTFEQEALLVSWFNEGPNFVGRFLGNRRTDPQRVPGPNEGGEAYLQNRKRILRALEE